MAAGGKIGGAGLAPPTRQVGAAVAALAALYSAIASATLSTISPEGWRCDSARGQYPKQVYSMCHLFKKATLPMVGKEMSWHTPSVFYPLRIRRPWVIQGLGMTSLSRSFRHRPLGTITPPPPSPLPQALPSTSMVWGAGGGSAAADASTTRWPAWTVRRSWRDLGSARLVYQP